MIIINADDWGRTRPETDAALDCFRQGRITSATAMVYMQDSERAAEVARAAGIDVGLHLNLTQAFTVPGPDAALARAHARVVHHLTRRKYTFLFFHPGLRADFRQVYAAQLSEFIRLYGRSPSHVDGHHHKHLCANVLLGDVIPAGEKVRRTFHFWPGEKSAVNRAYRGLTNRLLTRRYRSTDYFFALSQCLQSDRMDKVLDLAKTRVVEVMTHPADERERSCLLSDAHGKRLEQLDLGTYAAL